MSRRGVLLIACGDALYGRLAYNCAASLKSAEPSVPVALAHTATALSSLSGEQLGIFDHLIDASCYCDMEDGDFIRPKAFLNELTPFDATLFLDADTLWSPRRRVSDLLAELSEIDFTAMNYARYEAGSGIIPETGYTWWAPPAELERHYSIRQGYVYQQSTTFLWFRTSARIERFFRTVQELYLSPEQILRVILRPMRPDEVYFNVAGNRCEVYPHALGYQPVYFFLIHHGWPTENITRDFWAITTAGKYHSEAYLGLVNEVLAEHTKRGGRALFPFERRHPPQVLEAVRRQYEEG